MVRVKIDNRIRILIENGVKIGHRTMFVIVGDKGKDKVPFLHQMLSKATIKARPTVLWCYKKELGFSSHKKKRMKKVQQKIKTGKLNINEDDPFELFIGSTNIRYCYYSETQKILGNTYGMTVLQDFEALTPNLLARTIETVEGGGLVVILLRTLTSLRQLYTMAMDVHNRYRTEAHKDIVGRFNERFILSLSSCPRCLVVDDQLTVLPISTHILEMTSVHSSKDENDEEVITSSSEKDLKLLQEELRSTPLISAVVNLCKTIDQAKALLKFVEAISEKTLRNTVSLTAARGRGKSAALGLAVASAIAFGYANIFVTSPSPENLKTFFEFVFKGFDALGYKEHLDYGLVQSSDPEHNKALIRINIFKENRQTVQYIHPTESNKLSQAELLVIDEAAAIPLPYVKEMLGPYLIFMASTINGYEGTGRSLSLKLLQHLRVQSSTSTTSTSSANARVLSEVTLEESIRYKPGDQVEKWLSDLLCLDATNVDPVLSGTPPPKDCNLYYINRDTLFCYHKASEAFLQKVIALFVSSHYKNTPNDLQMLSDAPAHHLFCLLGPLKPSDNKLPEVLCAIQVCLEGQLGKDSVESGLSRGSKASGDLIPWTMAQQFQDEGFPSLAGARVVRIATHPSFQGMGYGSRALSLLKNYYGQKLSWDLELTQNNNANSGGSEEMDGEQDILTEEIGPREKLPPLLMKLTERPAERLDYIGVSYGLTLPLLKFWKRAHFVPVYIRQTSNDLTGEHSCIMLSVLEDEGDIESDWLNQFWEDFRKRFASLLSYRFRNFPTNLALSVISNKKVRLEAQSLTKEELDIHLSKYDLKRLQLYCNNLVDHHLIMDLVPVLAKLYFLGRMGVISLTVLQQAILLGLGLQHKSVDDLTKELELPASQLLGLYNRAMRKMTEFLNNIVEKNVEAVFAFDSIPEPSGDVKPVNEGLFEELEKDDKAMKQIQRKEKKKLKKSFIDKFGIKGTEEDWNDMLAGEKTDVVTLKRVQPKVEIDPAELEEPMLKKKKKKKKNKNEILF